MSALTRLVVPLVFCLSILGSYASPAGAQSPREGRLIVTVMDPTNAVIPAADVKVVGIDETTKKATIAPAKTSDKGIATFEHLAPGRYSVQGEFPGFQMGLLRDLRVKAGDNKHVMVLPLEKLSEEVTVGRDKLTAATDRAGTFGTALTREQVEALSDDPDEMARQLQDMAGPGATLRVDSFEGQQLPPKAQIKAVHITRDSFAAETHYAGGMFIDIITQPGVGPLRGQTRFGFYDSALDGVNPLIGQKGPAQNRSVNANIGGSLSREKSSFSLNIGGSSSYRTPNLYADTGTGVRAENLNLRQPSGSFSFGGLLDYAITKDQTVRLSFGRYTNSSENLGVGVYDLAERAYSTDSTSYTLRVQEAGPIGRRFFINTRVSLNVNDSTSHSTLEAPTIMVNGGLNSGGAQRAGGTHSRTVALQSDLDYVRGIQSWRTGIQVNGGSYRSDNAVNYLGTYFFENSEAYDSRKADSFTQRLGDPAIAYWNFQVGMYVQDDIRVTKKMTLSPGVRFEAQTHLGDTSNIAPRFGMTWAPFKSGNTTLRLSAGIFYDWLGSGTYEQTLRFDGFRQRELNISEPQFPDPGYAGKIKLTNRYVLGNDLTMARNTRLSAGIDQKITKTISVGATYANTRGSGVLVGLNLNPSVNGVRPDPAFENVFEAVSEGRSRSQSVSSYVSLSLSPSLPGGTAKGPRFSWKRGMGVYASYYLGKSENDTQGAFTPPASGTLATEWAPASSDVRHRLYLSLNTQAIKNLSASIGVDYTSGTPYTIITGVDENHDNVYNERPPGVGRNTERGAGQWDTYGYFSYTIGVGKRTVPGGIMLGGSSLASLTVGQAPDAPRYRLSFNVSADNLTNHANYTGYSGNMKVERLFLKPTGVDGVRRVTLNVGFSF